MPLDVRDVDIVRRAVVRHGPFPILVGNAGTNRPEPMGEVSEEDFDAVLDLKLRSAFFGSQAVVASLLAPGRWRLDRRLGDKGDAWLCGRVTAR